MDSLARFLKKNQFRFSESQSINPYLTMKIGNSVRYIAEVEQTDQLKSLLGFVLEENHPYILLGGGSNVIFSNEFSDFLVIINKTSSIEKLKNNLIKVSSGVSNTSLLKWCIHNNAAGLEFIAGIPGTIGGAAAVNAGAFGKSIADVLVRAEIITADGEIKSVSKSYFKFKYRDSVFKYGKQIILDLLFRFDPEETGTMERKIKEIIAYRKTNHPPYNKFTAGCFFRNPILDNKKLSAGKLIESSGLKGFDSKNLKVSDKHANFIINKGKADFTQLQAMECFIVKKVQAETGVSLAREVIYITTEGEKY